MKSPRRQLLLGCAGSLLAGALTPARVWAQPNEPLPGLEETLKTDCALAGLVAATYRSLSLRSLTEMDSPGLG